MRFVLTCAVAWCWVATGAFAGEPTTPPKFTTKPAATKSADGKVKVEFAVAARTDVEVAVLDAGGKVVRHLAAGVLGGEKPPPEPLKPGLAQALEWDGKDDLGKASAGGPFRVRVRIGMGAKFGRVIGANHYVGFDWEGGLAVGGDGSVYAMMHSNLADNGMSAQRYPWHVRKLDRAGKYVRTVLPHPAGTPWDKAFAFSLIDDGAPTLTPAVHGNIIHPVLMMLGNEMHDRVVRDSLVFVDSYLKKPCRLSFLKLDGSGMETVPLWPDGNKHALDIQVAFSPDGRWAYCSNVLGADRPEGRIWRLDLSKPGAAPEKFHDLDPADPGRGKDWKPGPVGVPVLFSMRTAAAGIATDAKGNVLVCDLRSQCVVELSPEGKKLSATVVDWPDKVRVNRKTGDLYVLSRKVSSGYVATGELIKITGRGEAAKVAARLPLAPASAGVASFALDDSGDAPVIWIAGQGLSGGSTLWKDSLFRIEDAGAVFKAANVIGDHKDAIAYIQYMSVDPEADLVYAIHSRGPVWRYDGVTGQGGLIGLQASDLAIGPKGTIYAPRVGFEGNILRYNRDLSPAPVGSTGKNEMPWVMGRAGKGINYRGFWPDPRTGNVYWWNDCFGLGAFLLGCDAEGKYLPLERKRTIPSAVYVNPVNKEYSVLISRMKSPNALLVVGPRLDAQGNVYIAAGGFPQGYVPPKGFEKDPAFRNGAGTILKFGPKGGEEAGANDKDAVMHMKGVLAAFPGVVGPWSGHWDGAVVCGCTLPRFDMDLYGRLYSPNGITYKAHVLDSNGNEILKLGAYGNFDEQGPGSLVMDAKTGEVRPRRADDPADIKLFATPELAFGWPVAAGASDRYIYIGDSLNHRVVRADKTWTAEETVPAQ